MIAYLNLHWLRPEGGPLSALISKSFEDIEFKSPSIDLSCGDGNTMFIHLGGRFSPDFDEFTSTQASKFKHSSFIDIHDTIPENFSVKIAKKPFTTIDYGTDWKQNLLDKAAHLGLYKNLICHDNNKTPLPFEDNYFKTIYSNSVYWVNDPANLIKDIKRILHPEGIAILHLFTPYHFETLDEIEPFLSKEAVEILDRKRRETMPGRRTYKEWKEIIENCGFHIKEVRNVYPNKPLIDWWNMGFRAIAHLLIQMANSLPTDERNKIKKEWIEIFFTLFKPLLTFKEKYNIENSPYLCFILQKNN